MKIEKKYILLLAGYSVILFFAYLRIQTDDAYIFYTYVQNITSGMGFVFNPGEKINAATSPLYTLLLSAFYFLFKWTGITVPVTAHIAGTLFLFSSAFLLFKIFNKDNFFPVQYLVPVEFLTNPLIRNGTGMEMHLVIFLVIAAVYLYLNNRITFAAVVGGLAILSRFDAGLFLIPLLFDLVRRKQFRHAAASCTIILLILLPWFIFSYYYFGTLLPATVKIKLLQQSTGYWGTGLIFLKGFLYAFPGGILMFYLLIFLFTGSLIRLIMIKSKWLYDRGILLFSSWIILYFITYSFILNPPPYLWYYTPFTILFAIVISLGVASFFRDQSYKFIVIIVLALTTAGLVIPVKTLIEPAADKYIMYRQAAEWINGRDEENPVTAIDEIGIIRFYLTKGYVRDILGLVNPEAVNFLTAKDFPAFIEFYKPDYIISDSPVPPPYLDYIHTDKFNDMYKRVKLIRANSSEIMIFQNLAPM